MAEVMKHCNLKLVPEECKYQNTRGASQSKRRDSVVREIRYMAVSFRPVCLARTLPPSNSNTMEKESSSQEKKRIVVCGGGVIGVCTAFFLAKKAGPTITVTLIEKSSVACAASGKAGGFLALDWCDGGPLSHLARTSFNLHRSLADSLDGPRSYGYRPLRTLSLSIDPNTSPTNSKTLKTLVPSWVDGPIKNPRTIGTVETTAQVHPKLFTRRILSSAMEDHGLELIIGELQRVEVDEGRVKGVLIKEEGGEIRAIQAMGVVLALGPWSGRFSFLSDIFQVSGLKAHSIVLKPKDPDAITPDALFLTYYPGRGAKPFDPEVYPRPTGEVYLCGMSEEAEVPDDPEQITGNPESIKMLHKVAATVSRSLAEGEASVVAEQACFLPCTEDNRPVIGEMPNVKGCYVATGHSCWGILNGPATGAAMAELVLDGHASIVDLTPFSPARFLRKSQNSIEFR
ncbi:FAD-dependent oxidoreductase family protein [Tasmannia lanceolata]|uniref:FAD-dependent oxidoreductase family protein n=1 Tax=Tasmannia lanceolata TaxID=3420 RepID=UPI00406471CE